MAAWTAVACVAAVWRAAAKESNKEAGKATINDEGKAGEAAVAFVVAIIVVVVVVADDGGGVAVMVVVAGDGGGVGEETLVK